MMRDITLTPHSIFVLFFFTPVSVLPFFSFFQGQTLEAAATAAPQTVAMMRDIALHSLAQITCLRLIPAGVGRGKNLAEIFSHSVLLFFCVFFGFFGLGGAVQCVWTVGKFVCVWI